MLKTTQIYSPDDFGTMTVYQLNDWYEAKVGYRPQIMSETDLRELCLSYWEATTETDLDDA